MYLHLIDAKVHVQVHLQTSPSESLDVSLNIFTDTLFMVNSSYCLTAAFIGHISVPQNRIGKHVDSINANRTFSDALQANKLLQVNNSALSGF